MKTSRLAVFHAKDQPFTYEDAPVPALGPGEFLVRNEYTTLCRSDLNTYTGKRTEKTPTILGHEIVGVIEELGPEVPAADCRGTPLRSGDRVTWAIYASDPCSCLARMGIPQKGTDLFKYGHELLTSASTLHGGLAEHTVLRKNTPIIRLDAAIPLPVLALINCSIATVAGSLRLAGEVKDRHVLIAGAGMLGIIACAMCRSAGARSVLAVDIDDARLAAAREFGVDHAIKLGSGGPTLKQAVAAAIPGDSVTVALDYSGVPDTMEALLAALGIGGTLVFIGATYPQRAISLNAELLVRNVHTIRGLHNYNQQDFVAAVEFIERHHRDYPFGKLVHDRFDLDAVDEAFAYGVTSGAHRVGLRCTRSR
jgi:putative phosphonate catabolism associated alcohol dehydrogenase